MKKKNLIYYKSENGNEVVAIDYTDLYHDYYSVGGRKRMCLGAATDRIEAFLIRRKYSKITKLQFEKKLEKYAEQD
jgi:hypothetical protein